MEKTISAMSPQEFELLVEGAIDRRMNVWLTQIFDALGEVQAENGLPFQTDFVASLNTSIEQAQAQKTITLDEFRTQLADG